MYLKPLLLSSIIEAFMTKYAQLPKWVNNFNCSCGQSKLKHIYMNGHGIYNVWLGFSFFSLMGKLFLILYCLSHADKFSDNFHFMYSIIDRLL